ncbi:hypothetical protein PIB30_079316, partial [Stylosanthes scabra]|nr:hypothetical protein [Stylosanthes scabra]
MSRQLTLSDPRISEARLSCGTTRAPLYSNYIPTFIKEMEFLSQQVTAHNWATHSVDGGGSGNTIYGLTQCFNDLSHTDCLLCYASSRTTLPRCLPSFSARIYLDGCFLRYDRYRFYSEDTDAIRDTVNCTGGNVEGVAHDRIVGRVIDGVVLKVVANGGSFAVGKIDGVYGLAQCWKTVGNDGCRNCLRKAGKQVRGCLPKKEGRALNAGCYLRYSTEKFYNEQSTVEAGTENNNHGQICSSIRESSLNYKYETLEKATDYFNPSRKIGQGGAGSVFKGVLPNGKVVAVKRLVFNNRQWVDEFFNEVNLISGIEHKNLVKLLGCSIEGPESLLVYEFLPNKSLDQSIFAEGLAYLHGGSKIRIIHRDIKSSNILLDENLTPKIADFGLARCFGADKTHLSTGIAGTL